MYLHACHLCLHVNGIIVRSWILHESHQSITRKPRGDELVYICVSVSVSVCVWGVCVCSQSFQVRIIDDEEYEKHENFFIVLEEPRWLKRGISGTLTKKVLNTSGACLD